jgi:hypothetical protein
LVESESVLRVFQKKSKRGVPTPKKRIEPDSRMMEGSRTNGQGVGTMKKTQNRKEIPIEKGSGNVYADRGYPDSEDMLIKAQLVTKIAEIIQQRRLTQAQAAKLLRLT